jgi:hypothetical protein
MLYVVHAVYGAAAAPATSLRPNLFLFLGAAVCCFNYNYKDLVPQPAHGEQLARLPVSGFPGAGLLILPLATARLLSLSLSPVPVCTMYTGVLYVCLVLVLSAPLGYGAGALDLETLRHSFWPVNTFGSDYA